MKITTKHWLGVSLLFNLVLVGMLYYFVQRMGGVRYFIYRIQTQGISALYEHRKILFEELPNTANEIIFLGDSITEQGAFGEFFQNARIKNRGIARDGCQGVLNRLDEVLEAKPDKVFLLIGINDLSYISPSETFELYNRIVNRIVAESPETRLYLQSVFPINRNVTKLTTTNEAVRQLNHSIESLAKRERLPYLNIHDLLLNDSGRLDEAFTSDGIHLNGHGYLVWMKAVRPYIEE